MTCYKLFFFGCYSQHESPELLLTMTYKSQHFFKPLWYFPKGNSWKLLKVFLFEHVVMYLGHDKAAKTFKMYVLYTMRAKCVCTLDFLFLFFSGAKETSQTVWEENTVRTQSELVLMCTLCRYRHLAGKSGELSLVRQWYLDERIAWEQSSFISNSAGKFLF